MWVPTVLDAELVSLGSTVDGLPPGYSGGHTVWKNNWAVGFMVDHCSLAFIYLF